MSFVLPYAANPTVTVPAAARVAAYSDGQYSVTRRLTFANQPDQEVVLFNGVGAFTSDVFASGATIIIVGSVSPIYYSVGTAAVVVERLLYSMGNPTAVNATGAVSAAAMLGGIVTSTTAAAVTGTMPTGTVLDAANTFAVNDIFWWKIINTGPNTFTLAGDTGHTIVGGTAVATGTSARFMTRKTAASTFVTYRG